MTNEAQRNEDTVEPLVRAPFALVRLSDLKVRRFQHKDELLDAVSAMNRAQVGCVPLIWNEGAEQYTKPEVWE